MNRYTEITPSKFNPLSMEEIFMAPMLKRKQHDTLTAQQELIRQGMLKVDPLDVHLDEATKLRNEMTSKIDKQAAQLAKEGVSPNSQSSIIALNREYQDLVAPTGRIGQINNAKKVYFDNMKEYLEDATKNKGWSRERALYNWQDKHAKQYTGYSDNNDIINIGQYGAPKKIEVMEKLKDVHGLLGEQVVNEMRASGYSFSKGPNGNGYVMVDSKGHRVETSNRPNLQSALNLLTTQLGGKEWQDSNSFEGTDNNQVGSQLVDGVNSMLKTGVVDNRSQDAQYIAPAAGKDKKDEGPGTAIAEAVGVSDAFSMALPKLTTILSPDRPATTPPRNLSHLTKEQQQKYYNDIKNFKDDPETRFKNNMNAQEQKMYIDTFNAKMAQGMLPRGEKMFSERAINEVKTDWELRKNFNFTNSVMIPGSAESKMLASPSLDRTEAKDRDAFVANRVALARRNSQELLFDEEGKAIDLDDVKGSVRLVGHYNPANILKPFGGNPDNTVSPHVVSYLGTDDKMHTALMPRDLNEVKGNPAFKAAKIINKTVNQSAINANNFTGFNAKDYPELRNADLTPLGINSKGLDGMRVKYNPTNNSYTLELLKDGKSQKTSELTGEQYQMLMYDMIE